MSTVIGLGGARRNAASAICVDGEILAVCEQERLTRVRRAEGPLGALPYEAIECVRQYAPSRSGHAPGYAVAEEGIEVPGATRFSHHFGHAATSFLTSPFDTAVILVCDRDSRHGVSAWAGEGAGLTQLPFHWAGPGFADVYSAATEAFGFKVNAEEHRLEALSRLGAGSCTTAIEPLVTCRGDRLDVQEAFAAIIAAQAGGDSPLLRRADLADGIQRHLGTLLLSVLEEIKRRFDGAHLCLGGGLFYNSYFTTLIAESGLYDHVFVPVNPGNTGLAVGAALAASAHRPAAPLSPFLGPGYDPDEIKGVLDNCKLSYDYLSDGELVAATTAALQRGQLAGWFQGRMEWGARALGNRSILASPSSPYTLENLNVFLKRREPHHSYSLSVCEEDAPAHFSGPVKSSFMEFEYQTTRPETFKALMPLKSTRLRVQTVGAEPRMLRTLLKSFGRATGLPVLVNTSYNGFHEPIVCSPRDAVRVFYGTGLDLAAIGNFLLRK